MEERPINPVTKQVLELGPPILFFVIYLYMRENTYEIAGTSYDGFIVAAAVFVPMLLVANGLLWHLTGKISRLQVFTAVLVVFFAGLTVWFNDERFFKMKTTIVYAVFAGLLGLGLLQGRSYLAWAMGDMVPMRNKGWMILTRRLALAFVVLAIGNEIVWRTMSTDTWVKVETFGFPLALFVFLWFQMVALQKYAIEPDDG